MNKMLSVMWVRPLSIVPEPSPAPTLGGAWCGHNRNVASAGEVNRLDCHSWFVLRSFVLVRPLGGVFGKVWKLGRLIYGSKAILVGKDGWALGGDGCCGPLQKSGFFWRCLSFSLWCCGWLNLEWVVCFIVGLVWDVHAILIIGLIC